MIPLDIETEIFKLYHEYSFQSVLVELIRNVDRAIEWYKDYDYDWEYYEDGETLMDNIIFILSYYREKNLGYCRKRKFFSIKTYDKVIKQLKSYWWIKNNQDRVTSLIQLAAYDEYEKYMYGGDIKN